MKSYLDFERNIKVLDDEIEKLKDPFNKEGLSEVNTEKISQIQFEIDKKLNYAIRWFRGIETKSGTRVQDIEFECEATINEIKALELLEHSDVLNLVGSRIIDLAVHNELASEDAVKIYNDVPFLIIYNFKSG